MSLPARKSLKPLGSPRCKECRASLVLAPKPKSAPEKAARERGFCSEACRMRHDGEEP
ncbi:MAG TPA: hypothetical protein VMN04_02530 [Thermoanaerobaculia bacterium]|nr:hypothetical protein [Thermoanaerobaculia bacterium]